MCQAHMKISLTDGLYYMYEFEPEHNHILATASQAHLLRSQRSITVGENNPCIPPTLEGRVYITHIHGPLNGPLYTWAQYTPTPPLRLNYRRSGVQDWTTKKLTPPAV